MTNSVTLTDGTKWFWWNTSNTNWGGIIFTQNSSGSNQTQDIDNTEGKTLTAGDNFYYYYPNGSGWKFSIQMLPHSVLLFLAHLE